MEKKLEVRVIGGGLAGCEAALQLASRGLQVHLYEMRSQVHTPAHQTDQLAELVCSNSFKGLGLKSAHGLLKEELRLLGSFLLQAAFAARVPAGESLTVDRQAFSQQVESLIEAHPLIHLHRQEITSLQDSPLPTLVAAGPLCSDALAQDLIQLSGKDSLRFFDAIAPVVEADSIDMEHAYFKNRWDKGNTQDFINCPLDRETYDAFVTRLVESETIEPRPFEPHELFEGCLPVEEMARRGHDTLRFGPMRPVGLGDHPETGRWHHAVIQLRSENAQGSLYNLVGFQTRLKWGTQKEIFQMVPALRQARFARYGSMHRNTFLAAPEVLDSHLRWKVGDESKPWWFAGQITGAEGYTEALATGWYAAWNMANQLQRGHSSPLPEGSCIQALVDYLVSPRADIQPMNFNFGLLPRPDGVRKSQRKEFLANQATQAIRHWIATVKI